MWAPARGGSKVSASAGRVANGGHLGVARGGVAVAANVELDRVGLSTSRFGATTAPNRELDERAVWRSRFAATMAAKCKLAEWA